MCRYVCALATRLQFHKTIIQDTKYRFRVVDYDAASVFAPQVPTAGQIPLQTCENLIWRYLVL